MPYSEIEIAELSKRIGRGKSTLRRWVTEGCDLRNHQLVHVWIEKNSRREPPVTKKRRQQLAESPRQANRLIQKDSSPQTGRPVAPTVTLEYPGNNLAAAGLPPIGKRGAAAALERLEAQEERAHARLEAALARGEPTAIDMAQTFWLKCSETLRRLDLAVEIARRQEETQIPLRVAQDAVLACAEWMRIAVTTFLSSETISLMGIKDPGEFRSYFGQRFVGNLHLIIKSADKTNSAIPDWAKERIKEAWNVQET